MWLEVTGSDKNIVLEKSFEFAVRIVKILQNWFKEGENF
jgi:hypothetical protein